MTKKFIIVVGISLILAMGLCGCVDEEVEDTDGDGYNNDVDLFPDDSTEWEDTDNDGYGDNSDAFPADASEHLDSDGDLVGDNADVFPDDPTEWVDSDGDGFGDNADTYPYDPEIWEEDWVEKYLYNLGNDDPLTRNETINITSLKKWKFKYAKSTNECIFNITINQKQNDTWIVVESIEFINETTGGRIYTFEDGFVPGEYQLDMILSDESAEVKIYEWELI